MKRKLGLALLFVILSFVFITLKAYAFNDSTDDGRYVVVMVDGSIGSTGGRTATKTPAVVLDSVLGIVWNCDNLQTESAKWYKTDLAKNGDNTGSSKRYVIKILDLPSAEPKIPGIVLDIQEGKVWTCPNLIDASPIWVSSDLVNDVKESMVSGSSSNTIFNS